MITLSQETGGKYYYADAEHLDAAFQKVSEDLRTQYLLAYYPIHRTSDSDYRKISVTLKEPPNAHYNVRNRTGYYATPGQ
jgi:Ca-activated chloride channel homolog